MPRRLGEPSGQCTVCNHVERTRIELLIAGGASHRALARKFSGLSHYSLGRHWARHVSPERKAALILGPVERETLAARVAEESESVIDHHRATRAGLYSLYAAALTAGDGTTGAMLSGRLTEVNNAIGRLTGQLATSPLIQNNVLNYFATDPAFGEFQQKLIAILRPFPQARRAVLDAFEKLDAPALPAPIEAPRVEHEVIDNAA